jgi:hypothetical protein
VQGEEVGQRKKFKWPGKWGTRPEDYEELSRRAALENLPEAQLSRVILLVW